MAGFCLHDDHARGRHVVSGLTNKDWYKNREWLTRHGALRVPEVTIYFWIVKALSTALGEATSDYLVKGVKAINPEEAVVIGFVGFAAALWAQFRIQRYSAWTYWFAVCMVGVFGTMAADVLHVGFKVPYVVSSILYAIVLTVVFLSWDRTEHTLSFHAIDTPRREAFYWAAVVSTFAMGTAIGDLSATTLHLGYGWSAILYAGLICIPAFGYRVLHWNAIFAFWFAYVLTRPLGASAADWIGKPKYLSGMGHGTGTVALVLAGIIFCFVAYLAITKADLQKASHHEIID